MPFLQLIMVGILVVVMIMVSSHDFYDVYVGYDGHDLSGFYLVS